MIPNQDRRINLLKFYENETQLTLGGIIKRTADKMKTLDEIDSELLEDILTLWQERLFATNAYGSVNAYTQKYRTDHPEDEIEKSQTIVSFFYDYFHNPPKSKTVLEMEDKFKTMKKINKYWKSTSNGTISDFAQDSLFYNQKDPLYVELGRSVKKLLKQNANCLDEVFYIDDAGSFDDGIRIIEESFKNGMERFDWNANDFDEAIDLDKSEKNECSTSGGSDCESDGSDECDLGQIENGNGEVLVDTKSEKVDLVKDLKRKGDEVNGFNGSVEKKMRTNGYAKVDDYQVNFDEWSQFWDCYELRSVNGNCEGRGLGFDDYVEENDIFYFTNEIKSDSKVGEMGEVKNNGNTSEMFIVLNDNSTFMDGSVVDVGKRKLESCEEDEELDYCINGSKKRRVLDDSHHEDEWEEDFSDLSCGLSCKSRKRRLSESPIDCWLSDKRPKVVGGGFPAQTDGALNDCSESSSSGTFDYSSSTDSDLSDEAKMAKRAEEYRSIALECGLLLNKPNSVCSEKSKKVDSAKEGTPLNSDDDCSEDYKVKDTDPDYMVCIANFMERKKRKWSMIIEKAHAHINGLDKYFKIVHGKTL